jgi:hypothetical protein
MKPILREGMVEMLAGAAGASFVAITQLATRESINVAQFVAMGCFSISLPIFTVAAISLPLRKAELNSTWNKIIFLGLCITGLIFVLGIAALLWSFGWYFAFIFAVST